MKGAIHPSLIENHILRLSLFTCQPFTQKLKTLGLHGNRAVYTGKKIVVFSPGGYNYNLMKVGKSYSVAWRSLSDEARRTRKKRYFYIGDLWFVLY